MPGLLKIGFTTRPVDERVQELNSATGIPARFVVEAFFPSCAPPEDEQAVYNALEPHRIQRREFVELEIGDALSKIEKTLGFSPLYRRSGSREAQVNEEANHIRTLSFSMFCGPCKYQWRAEGSFVPHRCPKCNSLSISVVSQD
jgi:Zn finger protein HypA/HybF involved in hydrogenase expression